MILCRFIASHLTLAFYLLNLAAFLLYEIDMAFTNDDRNFSGLGSFAPIVCLNNSTSTNKRQKNNLLPATLSLPAPSTTTVVMQQPLSQMSLPQHPIYHDGSIAGLGSGYRGWNSLVLSNASNAVTAQPNPPQDPVGQQEQIDHAPPPEEQNSLSSLQRALLVNDTSDDMEADTSDDMDANDHINSTTRRADVSDGRFNRKLKTKKYQGGERTNN